MSISCKLVRKKNRLGTRVVKPKFGSGHRYELRPGLLAGARMESRPALEVGSDNEITRKCEVCGGIILYIYIFIWFYGCFQK